MDPLTKNPTEGGWSLSQFARFRIAYLTPQEMGLIRATTLSAGAIGGIEVRLSDRAEPDTLLICAPLPAIVPTESVPINVSV